MAIHAYYPEMKQAAPASVTSHARLLHYGRKYRLRSTLGPDAIKGVGIVYDGQMTVDRGYRADSKFLGFHEYTVTTRAMAKLEKTVEIGLEILLD